MADLNEMLVAWTGEIDSFMYTYILVILLVFVGIYYTIRTKAVQIRYIKDMFTQLTEKKHVQGEKSISSFQALMVSTASRVGTGNIAGIATAVATGGPGAIFWMWLMALIGAASAFIESTLAQIYKIRGKEGEFRGGPAYYIQQGLGKRWLGIIFAWALILCFAFGFNGLQAFNMTSALLILVLERTRMIGLLKAFGMRNGCLRRIFLWRAALVTLRGLAWGNAAGLGLCLVQKWTHLVKLSSEGYLLSEVPVSLGWGWWLALNAGFVAAIVALLVIPTAVVSTVKPEETIRYE